MLILLQLKKEALVLEQPQKVELHLVNSSRTKAEGKSILS